MHRMKTRACAVAVLVTAVVSAGCASALGISLCEYRSPETLLIDAGLSFSYQFFDDADTAGIDVSRGEIDFSFARIRDTETFGFLARLDGHVGLAQFLPSSWLGDGETSFRYYVSSDLPLFGFGGLRGTAASSQTQPGLELQSGFGFGRFHDVTPLAKAMTIHRNLRDTKAIGVMLSDSVLTQIAQAIGGLTVAGNVSDVLASIETSVETAAGVQLDARSLLMIEDIVTSMETQRFCGFSIQAGLGYELLDPYGGPQGFLVVLSGDLAYAPDPSGQIEGHLSFSGPFDLANENTLTGSFSYEILISDSSSLDAAYSFQRVKPAGLAAVTTHGVTCGLLFEVSTADVLLGMTFSRTTGDLGWSMGFSVSAAMDLL
ncbi:hypothetical protein KJ567_02305 [Candidatus Bipolaricaulota bacterium]|nr:hypothetical protein [Candidatus Bipolaricaulota bacterium]